MYKIYRNERNWYKIYDTEKNKLLNFKFRSFFISSCKLIELIEYVRNNNINEPFYTLSSGHLQLELADCELVLELETLDADKIEFELAHLLIVE